MRRTAMVVTAFLGLTVWASLTGVAAAGTIKGTVRLAGASAPARQLKVTVDHAVCGTVKDAEDLVVSPAMGIRNAWCHSPRRRPVPGSPRRRPPRWTRSSARSCRGSWWSPREAPWSS